MNGGNSPQGITRTLPDEEATQALGREISLFARAGDWILLHGDLGTGKSTLARAMIRALAPASMGTFEVPSPTFTLVQPYDFTRVPVAHADLYRLADPLEAEELGLEELAHDHLLLVEWPDRLPRLPSERLDVFLEEAEDGAARVARMVAHGSWRERLTRMARTHDFLKRALRDREPRRHHLQGDASTRRYERVRTSTGRALVLMDMPARADGPPLRNGKSYEELAHLAREARAVAAINMELARRGYSAPAIVAHDFDAGLLLLEDLGENTFGALYAQGEERMREPLAAATDLLARMAGEEWPREAPLPDAESWPVPTYDMTALTTEADLFGEWFWPHLAGAPCPAATRREFDALMRALLAHARQGRPVWVLRDFHSPNLLWLEEREDWCRVGIIDSQDAVMGPAAYDLVSLLQDARVDIPEALEQEMLGRYLRARAAREDLDTHAFLTSYHVLGAQRAAKVLGIFTRLNARDGKPGYLVHLPRVARWLLTDLTRLRDAGAQAGAVAEALLALLDSHLPGLAGLARSGGNARTRP